MKLKDLRVGFKVRDSLCGDMYLVAAKDHPGYAGITLIADDSLDRICFDSAEPDNAIAHRREHGSNDYALSNVNQWLNSDGDDWFRPTSDTDRPPEDYVDPMMPPEFRAKMGTAVTVASTGFLSRFSPKLKKALLTVQVPTVFTSAEGCMEPVMMSAKVVVPSLTELGLPIDIEYPEGSLLKLMEDSRMKLCHGGYWTRTPGFRDSDDVVLPYHMRFDATSGAVRIMEGMLYKFYSNKSACSVNAVRPLMNLDGDIDVEKSEGGIYII